MKLQVRFLLILFAVLFLYFVASAQDEEEIFTYNPEEPMCAIPVSALDAQKHKMDGAEAAGWGGPGSEYIYLDDPVQVASLALPAPGNTGVVVIVVDFFTSESAINPNITHGDMVRWHTEKVINAALAAIEVDTIDLVPNQSDTIEIQDTLRQSVTNWLGMGYTNFVINMSFALIPCDKTDDVEQYDDATLKDYLDYLRGQIFVDSLFEDLTDEVCNQNNAQVAYVAAAGNAALPYPFYPGLWEDVVDVGALDIYGNPAIYSNGAGTWEIGAYWNDVAGEAVHGTSFAAPTHSVRLALEMSNGGTPSGTCGQEIPKEFTMFTGPTFMINGQPNLDFFESWEVSDTGLDWTFYIREGLEFADGNPFLSGIIAEILAQEFVEYGYEFDIETIDDLTLAISVSDSGELADFLLLASLILFDSVHSVA